MKKKRRCNLCGAKLTGDICPECGYNNASYHINRTEEECTHSSADQYFSKEEHKEHMDPEQESSDRWDYRDAQQDAEEEDAEQSRTEKTTGYDGNGAYDGIPNQETVTYGLNEERKRKKKSEWKKLIGILVLVWMLPNLISIVTGVVHYVSNRFYQTQTTVSVETIAEDYPDETSASDVQNSAIEDTAQTGEDAVSLTGGGDWQGTIRQGNYVAGIHLPAGTYEAVMISGYGDFSVYNNEEGYLVSEYFTADTKDSKRTIKDIELTAGTNVSLSETLAMELTAQNTLGYMEQPQNPLTETMVVEDAMICGRDFEPGTYHIRWLSGLEAGSMLMRKSTMSDGYETLDVFSFSEEDPLYSNMVIQEGDAFLKIGCELELEPAEYDISAYLPVY